ncbi:hypothetical protein LTR91_013177 [Friedmanniomyces endolithicus]|uniref:Uncharacterized protein n=2 Tax=Dothideomycetidae TaxID=451867 RepID=A0A4U0VBC3_9PEZI|nr:hypothetical protein LTS09_005911 [Friedmanniomyces endolithicus]KAK5142494.1 hypothetical protein LTR32_005175 [Rachicladosporium monterosium]KAK0336564.1 hypothetical protein LTR94_008174 [Friedmanniomyces endolithicus]KAK0798360.1 hypothetical protein LTR38_007905 [Friedmanniomyces endolithicus]KAK0800276.1 hypothetical protein LTR59_005806 [Friedmanniomyces endolithicus]
MPMIWNAEAHAKLLAALMQECDVKPNQENYAALAKLMGPDCTPKAIRHQVSKFRNTALAKDDSADDTNGKAKPAKTATAKAPKSMVPKKRSKKAARTPSPQAAGDGDDGDEDGAGPPTPPPTSSRPKREGAKRDSAMLAGGDEEGDGDGEGEGEGGEEGVGEDGMGKRLKIEVGEDIGEGLRQSTQFEDAMADGENDEDAFT